MREITKNEKFLIWDVLRRSIFETKEETQLSQEIAEIRNLFGRDLQHSVVIDDSTYRNRDGNRHTCGLCFEKFIVPEPDWGYYKTEQDSDCICPNCFKEFDSVLYSQTIEANKRLYNEAELCHAERYPVREPWREPFDPTPL